MKKTLLCSTMLLALSAQANNLIDPLIIEGENADFTEYNFHARLINLNTGEDFCSGVILTDKQILTTGHCLANEENSELLLQENELGVVIKNFNTKNTYTEEIKAVEDIIVHDRFNQDVAYRENDIALITLKHSITDNVSSIELAMDIHDNETFDNDTLVDIVGMGFTHIDFIDQAENEGTTLLRVGKNKILKESQCFSIAPPKPHLKTFCAVSEKGDGLHYLEGIQNWFTKEHLAYRFGDALYVLDHENYTFSLIMELDEFLDSVPIEQEFVEEFVSYEDPIDLNNDGRFGNGDKNEPVGLACSGDGGSSLSYVDNSGKRILLGLVAYTPEDCSLDNPVIFTRISRFNDTTFTASTWLKNNIDGSPLIYDTNADNNFGHSFGDNNFVCAESGNCLATPPTDDGTGDDTETPDNGNGEGDNGSEDKEEDRWKDNSGGGGTIGLFTLFGLALFSLRRKK